jgi:hypothetical protein
VAFENPWQRFGIMYATRDGSPVLAESTLWELSAKHPHLVERVSADEIYVHLDQPYRVVTLRDRAYKVLAPAPGRPAPPPKAAAASAPEPA